MARILGLDLGSNSIGWAIRETNISDENTILKYGVKIFEEGIKLEKTVPSSRANLRTSFRGMRRGYYRRLKRKYRVLKILIKNNMCPLSYEELDNWVNTNKKSNSIYPNNFEFKRWLALDFNFDGIPEYKNPYELRVIALSKELSKFELGRIFYHLTQRRGFLSNRKDVSESTDENNSNSQGTVLSAIQELEAQLGENETYAQRFATYDTHTNRIRTKYISRVRLIKEFESIATFQNIDENLYQLLKKEIYFHRPLKSQKQNVGHCTLEKSKFRCPISHFYFEEFRMYQFINNIMYWQNNDISDKQFLSEEHKQLIMPLFFRVSKQKFDFKEIADKIKKSSKIPYQFNYKDKTTVSGCYTTAQIINAIGDVWYNLKDENIKNNISNSKDASKGEISKEDVWNVLFSYDSDEKLIEWSQNKLGLSPEQAIKFSKIKLPQGYSSLSKSAIRKILFYLKKGHIYSYAVFMANIDKVLGSDLWELKKEKVSKDIKSIIDKRNILSNMINIANSHIFNFLEKYKEQGEEYTQIEINELRDFIIAQVESEYTSYEKEEFKILYDEFKKDLIDSLKNIPIKFLPFNKIDTLIRNYLINSYNLSATDLNKLYHPSTIDTFKLTKPDENGKQYLELPFIKAIKNPVLHRALFQIQKLINFLIKNGDIDEKTRVHIEFGRELNTINYRMAYEARQKKREKDRADAILEIKKLYEAETNKQIEPTETDILKYLLWIEQNRKCLYTNLQINIADLYNGEKFDIEHTLPRSQTLDNSMENKTICSAGYNRFVKQNRIPYSLPNYNKEITINGVNYPSILQNVEDLYKKKVDDLTTQFEKLKKVPKSDIKSVQDLRIRRKHLIMFDLKYYKKKLNTFETKEIPEGFKVSQGIDISIINRYATEMLKSFFDRVIVFQSRILKDVKDFWGIDKKIETIDDNNDLKKDRSFHYHHAIDAISLTFLRKEVYDRLANFYYNNDEKHSNRDSNILPWTPFPKFSEFIEKVKQSVIINHQQNDYALKQTKKIMKKKGKIVYKTTTENGNVIKKPVYITGKGIRLSLHQESRYGAIYNGNELKYVMRRPLNEENFKSINDFDKIVDPYVRELLISTINERTSSGMTFKDAINQDIYINKEKNIRIKKVRCFARVTNPIKLKEHLIQSENNNGNREHKKYVYVQNDGNYMVVVFDKYTKGKRRRDSYVYSNLEVARLMKKGVSIIDDFKTKFHDDEGIEIFCTLKKGDLVLFYENTPDEINWNNYSELCKRLYYANEFAGNQDKRIKFRHHLEARNDDTLRQYYQSKNIDNYKTFVSGVSKFKTNFYYPKLNLSTGNFNFLKNKVHFIIKEDGSIEKL